MQAHASPSLPEPDADSASHSARCAAYVRERIAASGGSISFAEYMQHVLYAPGLGYYAAGSTKFGAAGDFVTAPEVSPLFARVLARQAAPLLASMEGAAVLELGAGSGRLAADMLLALEELDAVPEQYRILEVSPDLRQRQESLLRERVPPLFDRVHWLGGLPAGHRGIVIANEVVDALPLERFVRRSAVMQVRVVADGASFAAIESPAPEALIAAVHGIEQDIGRRLPDGYVSEVSLASPHWVRALVGSLTEGCILICDYGLSRREYYGEARGGGWLRCHFRHHAHSDPFLLPGIQDVTAWVDFSAVAAAAVDAGAEIAGYTDQASFLIGGGIERELENLLTLSQTEQLELSAQAKMLTLPGAMGEHFKCMALCKGPVASPSAFRLADRTHTL